MRFIVSFKSHDKAVKLKRNQVTVCAPDDGLALEWGQKQAKIDGLGQDNLDITIGLVEDDLDEYIASRSGFSSGFTAIVNEAVRRREEERRAAAEAEALKEAEAKAKAEAEKQKTK